MNGSNMKQERIFEGTLFFIGFAATIVLANYFIKNVGQICVGDDPTNPTCLIPMWPSFGIGDGMVPSGVLWAGVALTLRDLVQRRLGFWYSWAAVAIGAGLSAFLDPGLALASGVAFFVAESLDLFVYTPLQKRNLFIAVIASNIVGLIIDSFIFLGLAGLPLIYAEGQIVGKLWMTLLAVPIVYLIRSWDDKRGMIAV